MSFFGDTAPDTWRVSVNGKQTEQNANEITADLGDTVRIDYDNNTADGMYLQGYDCFQTINGALPPFSRVEFANSLFSPCASLERIPETLFANNKDVYDFTGCFSGCVSLQEIPESLFSYCELAYQFDMCFYLCRSLKTVPEHLFASNIDVLSFNSCFHSCTSLTSVPVKLFANNTSVTDVSRCFYKCSALTIQVRIGSSEVTRAKEFAFGSNGRGTVFVPQSSTTAYTFSNDASTNVDVIEEP